MSTTTETAAFKTEVKELLGLMIHSLYSHREIFLRELISNASDALDKLRFESLTRPELLEGDPHLCVRLDIDPTNRILKVIDNGIGMTREELVDNLGTIARSGTRRFLEAAKEGDGGAIPELIGQFGVGFYSSFMVAEEVVVESWKAGEEGGVRWTSSGDGEYTIEDIEGGARGTQISLKIKLPGEDETERQDFLSPAVLHGLVRKYSDFVEYPIEMAAAHFEDHPTLEPTTGEDGVEVCVLNTRKPLWERPKDEISDEDHAQFYKHLTHDWHDPAIRVHFKAEGTNEYTALLYVPSERPLDLFDPGHQGSRINLYVRRVFVMADCPDLLPPWLRFVRGVVDARDLPLNVSREILQENRQVRQIRSRLVKKLLDAFGAMLASDREAWERVWSAFGPVIKEGIVTDQESSDEVAKVCLFESTVGDGPTTLAEYVERMPEGQESIYVLHGASREVLAGSPHVEALRERGYEALLLTDGVDEWVVERLREFDGKPVKVLSRGDVDFESDERREEREEKERELRGVLEQLERQFSDSLSKVRLSSRLKDSAAVLVDEEGAMGPMMERMMRQSGHDVPARKRILELNPAHPVVERLRALHGEDPGSQRLEEFGELLYGQALLAEGSPLPDPARFGKLVSDLMVAADEG